MSYTFFERSRQKEARPDPQPFFSVSNKENIRPIRERHPRTFGDLSKDRRRQSIALFPPCFESHSLDRITFIRSWRILERDVG
jgi:hypothetical protein